MSIEKMGMVNAYVCSNLHTMVTVNMNQGVTSFIIQCRKCAAKGINNMAKSMMYQVDQKLQPEFEFYTPTDEDWKYLEADLPKSNVKAMRAFVNEKNGLLIRERKVSPKKKLKIYVASSWRNEYYTEVVKELIALGHDVYDFRNPPNGTGFSWSSIDENWLNWTTTEYINALSTSTALKGFKSDFDAMKWADCCVMVLPCGRSANTEAGWMKGAGKSTFVYSPIKQEAELMYLMHDGIIGTLDQLKEVFKINSAGVEFMHNKIKSHR